MFSSWNCYSHFLSCMQAWFDDRSRMWTFYDKNYIKDNSPVFFSLVMEFKSFCNGSLWDDNLTWNAQDPRFTECFESTVLAWAPMASLIILTPMQILLCQRSSQERLSLSLLNFFKVAVTVSLVGCTIASFFLSFQDESILNSDILAVIIKASSYLLSLIFLAVEIRYF